MEPLQNAFLTVVTTVICWVLIEAFVNNAHRIKNRALYVFVHNAVVVITFAVAFKLLHKFVNGLDPFVAMTIGMSTIFILEFVVFRYLYSGDRWFLNYVDWILPISLTGMTIYLVGVIG